MQAQVQTSFTCTCPHCGVRYSLVDTSPSTYTCIYGECLKDFEVSPHGPHGAYNSSPPQMNQNSPKIELSNNFDY